MSRSASLESARQQTRSADHGVFSYDDNTRSGRNERPDSGGDPFARGRPILRTRHGGTPAPTLVAAAHPGALAGTWLVASRRRGRTTGRTQVPAYGPVDGHGDDPSYGASKRSGWLRGIEPGVVGPGVDRGSSP